MDFGIKTIFVTIKNSQDNSLVKRVQQVILNMLVIKDFYNKIFDYIDPWVETLESIALVYKGLLSPQYPVHTMPDLSLAET